MSATDGFSSRHLSSDKGSRGGYLVLTALQKEPHLERSPRVLCWLSYRCARGSLGGPKRARCVTIGLTFDLAVCNQCVVANIVFSEMQCASPRADTELPYA